MRSRRSISEGARRHSSRRATARLGSVSSQLLNVILLASLAAVGVWGHRTGWRAASLDRITGSPAGAAREDWCDKHNVPASRCIKCHPQLVGATAKDWCPEHGVPESQCTLCHPEILTTGVAGDWCPEHGVPESSCTKCHPEVAIKSSAPASDDDVRVVGASASRPENAAGRGTSRNTQPAGRATTSRSSKDPRTCQTHALRVQFASPSAVRKAGVRLGQVTERGMRAMLMVPSEVEYDRTRMIRLTSPLAGRAWRVSREVGDPVRAGEILALIDSVEVGRAKADLLERSADVDLKEKALKRQQRLGQSDLAPKSQLEEAEAALRAARARLFNAEQAISNLGLSLEKPSISETLDELRIRFLGLPAELANELKGVTQSANLIPVRAPMDGTVIAREVVAGEMIDTQKALFAVADTRHMWILAGIPQTDAKPVRIGQTVIFRPEDSGDESWTGQISWISTSVDDHTRTVQARAVVDNQDGRLRAHTFGSAEIILRDTPRAIVVPNEAVQWEGCCHIVFVRLTDDIFQVRKVRLGARDDFGTEITVGVLPGEVVATTGSHVLTSEILKSALGAGCCAE